MAEPRLLIVDDTEDNRAILARRLARRGYRIVEAGCGAAALAAVGRHVFDAVLLDVMMPEMDGLETLRRMRRLAGPADLPVIMVTARTESELIVEALQAGANDYVSKPLDFPVVVARLEAQVARKRAEAALRLANQELEARVVARTAELAEANQMLGVALSAAEAGSRAKSAFLAGMSHELRTPLNAILGFSELLRLDGAASPELIEDYAGEIHASGAALIRLVDSVLEVARAETGDLPIEESVFDLAALLASCARTVAAQAAAREVSVSVDLPADLPLVHGDAAKHRTMFGGLIDNAVKFNMPGGFVEIGAWPRPDGSLAVTIRDGGIGIEPDKLPLVTAPFAQADDSLARKHEGAGLGLPLARLIAEAHGGALRIESRPGQGCSVTVSIPPARLIARQPDAAVA